MEGGKIHVSDKDYFMMIRYQSLTEDDYVRHQIELNEQEEQYHVDRQGDLPQEKR